MALVLVNREDDYIATINTGTDVDQELGEYLITVSLIHDWGTIIVDEAEPTRDSAGLYSYVFADMASSGVHKIRWTYTQGGDVFVKDQFIEVVQRYITSDDFFNKYPELGTEFEPYFNDLEGAARKIIDTFCGQNFQYIEGSLTFDGNGRKDLYLGRRLDTMISVFIDETDVSTTITGLSDDEFDRYIQIVVTDGMTLTRFTEGVPVVVTGDWGFPYVPSSISMATELLILELMNDDRINYTHGIDQIWMDTQRTEFKDGMFDTTGNLDVDTLIMDYMVIGFEYV
jgi:hypothetical protein